MYPWCIVALNPSESTDIVRQVHVQGQFCLHLCYMCPGSDYSLVDCGTQEEPITSLFSLSLTVSMYYVCVHIGVRLRVKTRQKLNSVLIN